jgi:tRNA pseudouridine55 synthase
MIDGILKIYKEEGITSYMVIRKLKRVLPKGQKIGHAGTLDPFAKGLLLVLLGKATKLMNKIHEMEKEYIVTAEFGYMTDTQDYTGQVTKKVGNLGKVSKEDLEKVIKETFSGDILQTPPSYSAVHVNGMRAYDMARAGKEVVLKPKQIHIRKFEVLKYDWPIVKFQVICSTGTYVRTLVSDLGEKLGVYATAVALERVRIGSFDLDGVVHSEHMDANVVESIIEMDKVNEIINNEQR